jgi:hypothetical protein
LRNYTIYLRQNQYEPQKDDTKATIQVAQNKLDEETKKSFLKQLKPYIKKKEITVLKDEASQLKDWRPSCRLEVADKLEPDFYETMRKLELVAMIDADYREPIKDA